MIKIFYPSCFVCVNSFYPQVQTLPIYNRHKGGYSFYAYRMENLLFSKGGFTTIAFNLRPRISIQISVPAWHIPVSHIPCQYQSAGGGHCTGSHHSLYLLFRIHQFIAVTRNASVNHFKTN